MLVPHRCHRDRRGAANERDSIHLSRPVEIRRRSKVERGPPLDDRERMRKYLASLSIEVLTGFHDRVWRRPIILLQPPDPSTAGELIELMIAW